MKPHGKKWWFDDAAWQSGWRGRKRNVEIFGYRKRMKV